MLTDDEIVALIRADETSPEAICRALVAHANAAGGTDNITTVIARFDAESPARAEQRRADKNP